MSGHCKEPAPARKPRPDEPGHPTPERLNVTRKPTRQPLLEDKEQRLPHERDESTGLYGTGSSQDNAQAREVMHQAGEDIARGLKDTERRGTPSDVPGGKP